MVYLHFPSNLTEEELMLQAKYAMLRKKKALQAFKTPKPELEKNIIPKKPADARDAREVARKLLKSGAIQAFQKPQIKQESSFKRPKGQEQKRAQSVELSNGGSTQYRSFGAAAAGTEQIGPSGEQVGDGMLTPASGTPALAPTDSPHTEELAAGPASQCTLRLNLYQQYERDRSEVVDPAYNSSVVEEESAKEKPRTGNTVYVSGNKVTEEFLKKYFGEYGEILNISMEIEKGRGFVTYAKIESADRSIAELHSKTVGGIQLQVQLARRQPQINPINEAGSSAVWSALATNRSQKGKHKDNREMVCYDYDDIF
ncbi:negative elongation factor E-like isoform X2 [Anopheles darlingi]|uniref:negative elongation factor E-like isoform X2 n=1 Tax=Anopheles darlingi TaxID=43151 RepID=UPI00210017B5|nr:negative elongation factor E-like isoform X2 [Anopheles darlingi]